MDLAGMLDLIALANTMITTTIPSPSAALVPKACTCLRSSLRLSRHSASKLPHRRASRPQIPAALAERGQFVTKNGPCTPEAHMRPLPGRLQRRDAEPML